MNSDDVIDGIIVDCGFQILESELNDEDIHLKLASYIRDIKKRGTKVVSIVGGAGSGKSTLARGIAETLQDAATISTDDFVLGSRDFRMKYLDREGNNPLLKYDFDLLRRKVERIQSLSPGESECVPLYNQATGIAIDIDYDSKTGRMQSSGIDPCVRKLGRVEYLIVEGDFQVLEKPDRIIFFHVPDTVRLQNRVHRDLIERGASAPKLVIENFLLRQKIQHLPYTMTYADSSDLIITVRAREEQDTFSYKYSLWKSPHVRS